jgi:hypothetical protein
VPNSQLVTEKVTNWTLSDKLRRVDLSVGVNYGANPKKVVDLLIGVAAAHPQVLKHPAREAFFLSYGDSSINFELRVWPSSFSQWMQVRSDLATAVFDAVKAGAGYLLSLSPTRGAHTVRWRPAVDTGSRQARRQEEIAFYPFAFSPVDRCRARCAPRIRSARIHSEARCPFSLMTFCKAKFASMTGFHRYQT